MVKASATATRVLGAALEFTLSLADIGKLLKMIGPPHSNLERGYAVISVPKLIALADVLDVSVAELVEK